VKDLITYTVTGIAMASVYAIAASGLVVTYTTSGIFNFAHGAFGTLSGFVFWQLSTESGQGGWGIPRALAFAIVVLGFAPLFGALVERVIMRGLEGATEVVRIVVTVSLLLAVIGLVNWIWPGDVTRSMPRFFGNSSVRIGGVNVAYNRILILVAALLVAGGLRLVLYKSRMGIAMRAVVDDRSLVRLNGARPGRISMFAWALGSGLAALSGILSAPLSQFDSITLTYTVVNCYAAAVFGKLKSLPMTFLGALILGLAESYYAGFVVTKTPEIGGFSTGGFQFALPAIMMMIVMVAQPQARLRTGGIQRTRAAMRVPTLNMSLVGAGALIVAMYGITTLIPSDPARSPLVWTMYFALVSLSLVPLTGFAGSISLGQMTFVGLGAVVMSKVAAQTASLGALIVALVVCAVVGAIIALPALRLTGIYLALSTVSFSLVMSKVFFSQRKLANGNTVRVEPIDLGFWKPVTNQDLVMLGTVVFALLGVGVCALRRSSYGRRLIAMKDSPVACATLGLDLTRTKIGVFAFSASIAGLAGALSARSVPVSEYDLLNSMSVSMLAVVGGIGAVGGALMGGLMLGGFQMFLPRFLAGNVVGIFQFFNVDIKNLLQVAPGIMGISLGRNPDGAAAQIAEAFRPVTERKDAFGLMLGGPVIIWLLARSGTVTGWGFVAMMILFLLAIVPLLPVLFAPIEGGRALPAGVWLIACSAIVGGLNWHELLDSNGTRVVAMIVAALVAAFGAVAIHGKVPKMTEPRPSPDLLGIDRPIMRADVLEAETVLGVSEGDFGGLA